MIRYAPANELDWRDENEFVWITLNVGDCPADVAISALPDINDKWIGPGRCEWVDTRVWPIHTGWRRIVQWIVPRFILSWFGFQSLWRVEHAFRVKPQ